MDIDIKDDKEKNSKIGFVIAEDVLPKEERILQDIEVDKITISEENMRKHDLEKDMDSLAEDIKKIGLSQPIEVRRKSVDIEGGGNGGTEYRYEVVAGFRRFTAAKRLGWTKIKAWIFPDVVVSSDEVEEGKKKGKTEEEIRKDKERMHDLVASFGENINRLDADPRDRARQILQLVDIFDGDWIILSEILNRSVRILKEWSEYAQIPEKIKEMVAEKKIGQGYAKELVKYSEVDPNELVKIAEKIGSLSGSGSKDRKDAIIGYIRKEPKSTADDIDKKLGEGELIINIKFDVRVARAIKELSDRRGEEPKEFIRGIIKSYLESKGVFEP